MQNKNIRPVTLPEGVEHGEARSYNRYLCRCDICRTEESKRTKRYRKNMAAKSSNGSSLTENPDDYRHGTRQGYMLGCRCGRCRDANREDSRIRYRKRNGYPLDGPIPRKVAQCGTRQGYSQHRRLGEPSCEACLEATRAYARLRRSLDPSKRESREGYKPRKVAQCGTMSGATRHRRLGEELCLPCREEQYRYRRMLKGLEPLEAPKLRMPIECGTVAGYNRHVRRKEQICESCQTAARRDRRIRAGEDPDKLIPEIASCGTRSAYNRHLRNGEKPCEDCRKANLDAHKKLRKTELAPDDPRHGTRSGYSNYRCRCGPCKKAGSEQNRETRLRREARKRGESG